jgi:hypothetical protein
MNAHRQSRSIFKYFDNITLQEHQEIKQERVMELKHIDESTITAGFMPPPISQPLSAAPNFTLVLERCLCLSWFTSFHLS